MNAPVRPSPFRALLYGGAVAASLLLFELIGMQGDQLATDGVTSPAIVVTFRTLLGAAATFLWLAPMVFFARLLTPFLKTSPARFPIRVAIGLGIGFSLTHLLAWQGAFSPACRGLTLLFWCAAALLACFMLARWAVREWRSGALADTLARSPLHYLLALPAIIILFMAASQPPGWLWGSEFGGFDSLSYHLQLPQEWIASGRLTPVTHNVYSFLPCYVESVFMQFGAAAQTISSAPPRNFSFGLLNIDGLPLYICQHFHVWCAIIGAWLTARVVALLTGSTPSAGFTFAALLSVPWVIVTGSLSYNECAVLALFAGAMLVAAETGVSASVRTAVAAFLIGVACGCKPTAILFCAVPVGLMLLRDVSLRALPRLVLIAVPVGLCTLAPWLIRNYLVADNPVFPQFHSWFGESHWTTDQFARYATGHSFSGSLTDRFTLLFSRERGLFHPQFALAAAALLLLVPLLVNKATRKIGFLLTVGILSQLIAWLFATHLQSRFLMPVLVPLAIATGLVIHAAWSRRLIILGFVAAIAYQGLWDINLYLGQHAAPPGSAGRPNFTQFVGPGYFTGEIFRSELDRMSDSERQRVIGENLGPEAYINLVNIDPHHVLLVGDATPLYFGQPQYATTWDSSPLFAPGNPPYTLSPEQLGVRGIHFLLVNFAELERYQKSHWNDPRLSSESLSAWLKLNATPVKTWNDRGVVLFEIRPESRQNEFGRNPLGPPG